jgi:hypothetical protein
VKIIPIAHWVGASVDYGDALDMATKNKQITATAGD